MLVLCQLAVLAQTPAVQAVREPSAIISAVVTTPVTITPSGNETGRPAVAGDLLYPGDKVEGRLALVVECHNTGSVQWTIQANVTYMAGRGPSPNAQSDPQPKCHLPQVPTSADEQHLNVLTAERIAGTKEITGTDFDEKLVDGIDRELGGFEPRNPMSLLRRAVALEEKGQLRTAIENYTDLGHTWTKATWIPAKVTELQIQLVRKLRAAPKPGRGHVAPLIIGISDYAHGDLNYPALHFAHLDAESFAAYLKQLDPDRPIEPLTNTQASRSSIETKLVDLASQAADGATAVVFISAHGFQDATGSYIAAYDAHQAVGVDTAIPVSLLLSKLSGFERAYLFVDACRTKMSTGHNNVHARLKMFADGLAPEATPQAGAGNASTFVLLSTKPGTSSTEGTEFRDRNGPLAQDGHGAFTYYLLKSLYLDSGGQPRKLSRGELELKLERAMQKLRPQQFPDGGGTLGWPDDLDPLMELPITPPARTKGMLGPLIMLSPLLQKAAFAPLQQSAELNEELVARLGRNLASDTINPDSARAALSIYHSLSPIDQRRVKDTIRVALEDAGQRLLLNYLDGYEVEPEQPQFQAAATYYTLAEELAPRSPLLQARAAFNAGRALLFDFLTESRPVQRDQIFDRSTALLFDAYREDPGPYVLNGLGIAYMEKGDWPHAIAAFRDAIRRAPLWLYPKHNLALSLMRSGKSPEAMAQYQDAIKVSPQAHSLHFNLALLYQQTNQLSKAEGEYKETERLLSLAGGDQSAALARLYNAEGTLAAQRRDRKKALKLYEKARTLVPGMKEAVHNIALLKSPAEKEALLRQNEGYLNSRIELALMLKQQKRTSEAIPEYEEIVRQKPDFAAARLDLAQLYLTKSRADIRYLQRALEEIGQVEAMDAKFWRLYLAKAEAAAAQGQTAVAKKNYQEARRRAPDRAARREIQESEKGR